MNTEEFYDFHKALREDNATQDDITCTFASGNDGRGYIGKYVQQKREGKTAES
jgi:hypothetical protein